MAPAYERENLLEKGGGSQTNLAAAAVPAAVPAALVGSGTGLRRVAPLVRGGSSHSKRDDDGKVSFFWIRFSRKESIFDFEVLILFSCHNFLASHWLGGTRPLTCDVCHTS